MLVLYRKLFNSNCFVLYVEVYVIDKTCCENVPNQTMDCAVNPGLIMN